MSEVQIGYSLYSDFVHSHLASCSLLSYDKKISRYRVAEHGPDIGSGVARRQHAAFQDYLVREEPLEIRVREGLPLCCRTTLLTLDPLYPNGQPVAT